MSKKSTKALASAALMSLVLTTALSAGPVKAAQGKVTRTSGTTRYATAAEVAKTNWAQGSKNVVLVSGEGYADAVSASALAKKLDAPILLTASDTLSSDAKSALDTLKPENVYVIGGNASISQNIRDGLKADKYNLTELGGTTRYETNAKVADELVKLGVDPSNVMVVGGEGFSDALSVAPVAAAKGQILLLASNDQSATQPVIDFVKANNSKATVVGTKNVINDTIYDALGAASRVDGGTSRFDTNLKVLDAFKDSLKTDKVYIANASAADPDNLYADALVASAVAGKYSAPLVLVDKDGSEGTTNALAYLKNNTDSSTDVQLIGGTAVVPQSIEDDINALYNPQDQDQATAVDSVESNGLNQIKVTFNGKVDEDTAEEVSNYKVDGDTLTDTEGDNAAVANLQDDDKTVLITLSKEQKQNDDVDVTVKKGILSEDKSNTISEFNKTITFSDTTVPTVGSLSVRGNNKLDIKFSEPVKAKGENEKIALQNVVSKLKINGKNLASFGINYDDDTDDTTDGELDYSSLDNAVKSDTYDYFYTDEVELYFDDKLPTGENTLKVSDGDESALEDAAGFPIAETTQSFDVDELSSTPEINSITAKDDGKVKINFDRPMDTKTAENAKNYEINDGNVDISKAELKEGDTQVKLTVSGLNKGSNKLYIKDNVKDAYGNEIPEDTYKSFDLDEDTTKPTVSSIYTLDDDTVRVKFNKDVDALYATDKSNYTLKDNDGTDITNKIDDITVPGKSSVKDGDTTNVVDINVGEDLTDSTYTLIVENIQDRATTPNVMDKYTDTFDGSADVNAKVNGAYKVGDGDNKIVLIFNKAMDSSTLDDTDNYEYVNGEGDTKTLPGDADITVSDDNKSVTIDLPKSLDTKGTENDENSIESIYATGVKDENGNSLSTGNNGGELKEASDVKTSVKDNSLKVSYDGDDLKANVSFTNPIDEKSVEDSISKNNVTLGDAKVEPTSYSVDGSNLTLTFASDSKKGDTSGDDKSDPDTIINTIKAQGNGAKLEISGIKDILDQVVTVPTGGVEIYNYDAAPKLIATKNGNFANNWYAKYFANGDESAWDGSAKENEAEVSVRFDTPIDSNSVQASDFKFDIGGADIDATSTAVVKNNAVDTKDTSGYEDTVVFKFTGSDLTDFENAVNTKGRNITVKPVEGQSSISTIKDGAGNHAYYTPSKDDLKTTYVTLTEDDMTGLKENLNETLLNKLGGKAVVSTEGNTYTLASGDAIIVKSVTDLGATVKDSDGNTKTSNTLAKGDVITLNGIDYTVQ